MTTVFFDVFAITKKSLILIQQIPFFDLRQLRGYVPLNLRLLTIMILLFVCLSLDMISVQGGETGLYIYIFIIPIPCLLGSFFIPWWYFNQGNHVGLMSLF